MDIGGFKTINDSLDHTASDDLLKVVAQQPQKFMLGGDTVARPGGDEFVVLIEQIASPNDAGRMVNMYIRTAAQGRSGLRDAAPRIIPAMASSRSAWH